MGRIELRSALMTMVGPPVIFAFVGVGIMFSAIALLLPMVSLISGLS